MVLMNEYELDLLEDENEGTRVKRKFGNAKKGKEKSDLGYFLEMKYIGE